MNPTQEQNAPPVSEDDVRQAEADREAAQITAELTPALGRKPMRSTIDILEILKETEHRDDPAIRTILDAEINALVFDQDWRQAQMLAMSGVFSDLKGATPHQSVAKAMTKIRLGREWKLTDMDSMRSIYFVNGRPALENDIVASRMREAGFDWDPEWTFGPAEADGWKPCTGCTIWPKKWSPEQKKYMPLLDRKGFPVSIAFTRVDAQHIKTREFGKDIKLSEKETYKSWGQDMYYWRCIGRLRKYYANHVLRGAPMNFEASEVEPPETVPEPTQAPAAGAPADKPPIRTLEDDLLEKANGDGGLKSAKQVAEEGQGQLGL
jgi:hypothetical protein